MPYYSTDQFLISCYPIQVQLEALAEDFPSLQSPYQYNSRALFEVTDICESVRERRLSVKIQATLSSGSQSSQLLWIHSGWSRWKFHSRHLSSSTKCVFLLPVLYFTAPIPKFWVWSGKTWLASADLSRASVTLKLFEIASLNRWSVGCYKRLLDVI